MEAAESTIGFLITTKWEESYIWFTNWAKQATAPELQLVSGLFQYQIPSLIKMQ